MLTHIRPLHTLPNLKFREKPLHTRPNLLIRRHRRMNLHQRLPQLRRRVKARGEATHECHRSMPLRRLL